MKNIHIQDFLGLHDLAFDVDNVTLIAGLNGAGKSSAIEALRYAYTLTCDRISPRTNKPLINQSAKDFLIEIHDDGHNAIISKESKTPATDLDPAFVKIALDGSVYGRTPDKERKALISRLLGVSVSITKVCEEMAKRGIDKTVIEKLRPFMKVNLDTAAKKANEYANSAKSEWKGITGEAFGSIKSKDWEAPVKKPDLLAIQDQIITGDVAGMELKKETLKSEISSYRDTLAEYRNKANQQTAAHEPCPSCGTLLTRKAGKLIEAEPDDEGKKTTDYAKKIKQVETSLKKAEMDLDALTAELSQHFNAKAQLEGAEAQAEQEAKDRTKRAGDAYQWAMKWDKAASELAPDKIPALFMQKLPSALNAKLAKHCENAGFETVSADIDLQLSINGIPYGLLSESQQWRCDALMAIIFAEESGLKFAALDRLDVLNPQDRGGALIWLTKVDFPVVIAATLKAKPAKLPAPVECVWLGNDAAETKAA